MNLNRLKFTRPSLSQAPFKSQRGSVVNNAQIDSEDLEKLVELGFVLK
jgi:hypothetical protein